MDIKRTQTLRKRKNVNYTSGPLLLPKVKYNAAACDRCHSVLVKKRWTQDEDLYNKTRDKKGTAKVVCPSCQNAEDRASGGIVKLKGKFLAEHKKEILTLIRNEEQRARGFNPLGRIMSIHEIGSGVEIKTTNDKLVQRIGKSLQKAYQGRVYYKWSDDTKLLQAEWEK
ncbi:MAG: BCAM0308 family protein [Nitrospirota bacterium]